MRYLSLLIKNISTRLYYFLRNNDSDCKEDYRCVNQRYVIYVICSFFFLQILIPWRHTLYPGELFWTEQGYRFSWRVMLIEKSGHTSFIVVDKDSGKRILIDNDVFLTDFQQKQMSFQPDFILEYAHYLGDYYKQNGVTDPMVFAESYVTLNGRMIRRYIDKNVDLYKEKESFADKKWILKFNDDIKGF